jgi:hypothetical protein
MSDPASATLSAPPGNGRREQHRARGPSSRRPNGQDGRCSHTWQDGAQAELADDADARTATVNRSSERLPAPFPCEGRRETALTVVTASCWERARRGQPPRRSQGTTSERADRPRADSCFALAEQESGTAGPAQLVLVRSERELRSTRAVASASKQPSGCAWSGACPRCGVVQRRRASTRLRHARASRIGEACPAAPARAKVATSTPVGLRSAQVFSKKTTIMATQTMRIASGYQRVGNS